MTLPSLFETTELVLLFKLPPYGQGLFSIFRLRLTTVEEILSSFPFVLFRYVSTLLLHS